MAKKAEVKPTVKSIWKEAWEEYKKKWKELWDKYKTVIIPFIEGTFAYAWQLVYGLLKLLGTGIYGCGKLLLEKIVEIITKA